MPRRGLILVVLVILSTSAPAFAGEDEAPAEGVSVTIYNAPRDGQKPQGVVLYDPPRQIKPDGWAVVKQRQMVQLREGNCELKITNVAAAMVPSSVSFKSLTDPEQTQVLEQNFLYDLTSVPSLLRRFVDNRITVVDKGATREGTLHSANAGLWLSLPGKNTPMAFSRYTEVRLPALPNGLVTRPTLHWHIQAKKAGEHLAEIGYLTDAFSWRADYSARVDAKQETLNLRGWATIENESGATYRQARLKLMGGDVQRLREPVEEGGAFGMRSGGGRKLGDAFGTGMPAFVEKEFFEYHLYTLDRPTTLPDRSRKQLQLFPPVDAVSFDKIYVYEGSPPPDLRRRRYAETSPYFGYTTRTKVDVYMEFKNAAENHLGLPLPAGRVRVYLAEADTLAPAAGAERIVDPDAEFIGEDEVGHTPKDEAVSLRLGCAFDLSAERRQSDFKADPQQLHQIIESFEIKLRNHKQDAVTVRVHENLCRWVNWEIVNESHEHRKLNAHSVRFLAAVPADGEAVLKYTVRYDW